MDKASSARQDEAQRARAFYDALSFGVVVRNAEDVIVYANPAALCMLPGWRADERGVFHSAAPFVLRDEQRRTIPETDYPSAVARRTGKPVRGTLLLAQGTDGEDLWLLCDAVPVVDAATGIVGDVIFSLVDVTERRQMRNELRESEDRFRAMIDSLGDGIVLQLADFSITTCNESAVRITGLTAEQMLGREPRPKGWLAIREDGSRFDLREHPSIVALVTGEPSSCIMGVQSDGRDTRWIAINTRPMFHKGASRPYAALSSVTDITARVIAQDAERRAREAAEAASRAKSDFLANMSHEIRTPMNGVLGMLELVLATKLDATQREYLEVAQSSAESLLAIINDILDFSKIEAGRLDLRPEPFSLADCIGDALHPFGQRAAEKGLELAMRVAPGVPPILVGDALRLRQVITNLVANAVKFTERGEIVVMAEPESYGDPALGSVVHFAVRDTGIGIPKNKQQMIFEAFTQADSSATRLYSGTGLGLAICRRLIDLMDGRLWVESEEGDGSTFHFTARFAARPASFIDEGGIDAADLRGIRVLVVDDNGTNRLVLHEILTSWGMQPAGVDSGRNAIAAIDAAEQKGTPFQLLLVDGFMPEMDGFTLIETLRARPTFTSSAVLMLTSASRDDAPERCRALGIAAHLLKPVKSRELRGAIGRALGQAARRTETRSPDVLDLKSQHPSRLLLAEDNLVNQKLAIAILERWGHTVTVVEDGRAALAAVARERYEAILMDVQMPTMDGLRATEEIRAAEQLTGGHVPIVAMTARTMSGDRERCLEAGMDAYVGKPFDFEEFFRVLESVLTRD